MFLFSEWKQGLKTRCAQDPVVSSRKTQPQKKTAFKGQSVLDLWGSSQNYLAFSMNSIGKSGAYFSTVGSSLAAWYLRKFLELVPCSFLKGQRLNQMSALVSRQLGSAILVCNILADGAYNSTWLNLFCKGVTSYQFVGFVSQEYTLGPYWLKVTLLGSCSSPVRFPGRVQVSQQIRLSCDVRRLNARS